MESGWEKLKDRREKHKLVQFYKMTKHLTPHYISCLVPQAFANIHDYNFSRNSHGFRFFSVESHQPFRCPVMDFCQVVI
jgi:hypothetical protein